MSIYFDHAATTKVLQEAAQSALLAMTEQYGNPSSRHRFGTDASKKLSEDRSKVAAALNCLSEEILFTSGGTEANNWASFIAEKMNHRRGKHIITTQIEHSSVLDPIASFEAKGYEVTRLAPDRNGYISVEQVKEALRPDTIFVSMMLVNNETGTILPIAETAQLLRDAKSPALFHCDAVQAFLKIPFSPKELDVDFLSISAHKIGATKGCGALYVKKGHKISPMILGGGQEHGLRSGTEATAQIAAFATASQIGASSLSTRHEHMTNLKAYALEQLQAEIKQLVVVSSGDAPHVCAISLPGYPSEMLVRDLSDRDIFVSSGSACHKGKPSHVFAALKLPPRVLMGVLRLSFSAENTTQEVDLLCTALKEIVANRIPVKA